MKVLRIEGERIYLRPLTQDDATPTYVRWLNDWETTQYMESGRRTETVDSIGKYIAKYEGREDALFLAIVLKDGDRHVGNLKLEPINRLHRNAVLGIMIGDKEARGIGIGTEAIRLMLQYAFDEMKLHRVALGVTSDNMPGIECYSKIGFEEEGRLRDAVLREGGYIDSLWMAILADDFRED